MFGDRAACIAALSKKVACEQLQATLTSIDAAIGCLQFNGERPATLKALFNARSSEGCTWASVMQCLDALEALYRAIDPSFRGYQHYPEPQRRARTATSSYELRRDARYGDIRAFLRAVRGDGAADWDAAAAGLNADSDRREWNVELEGSLTWCDVLRDACAHFSDVAAHIETRRNRVFALFGTPDTTKVSVVTDGVDVKVCNSFHCVFILLIVMSSFLNPTSM